MTHASIWHIDPWFLFAIAVAVTLYILVARHAPVRKKLLFFTGIILCWLSIGSPLHYLAMQQLFSAHMIMHMTILLLATPLIVAGIPSQITPRLQLPLIFISRIIQRQPWIAWLAGVGIMWFWHIPVIVNVMFREHAQGNTIPMQLHIITLIISGLLFCWPLLTPVKQFRLSPPAGVLYLATACMGCSLIGLLITFAPPGLYHPYGYMPAANHITGNILFTSMDAATDMQLAGLIMWVPGCLIYLSGCIYLLRKWFHEKSVVYQ